MNIDGMSNTARHVDMSTGAHQLSLSTVGFLMTVNPMVADLCHLTLLRCRIVYNATTRRDVVMSRCRLPVS